LCAYARTFQAMDIGIIGVWKKCLFTWNHEIYREKFWGDEQLCKLAVGCAQQPQTEISDNIYELEEDEDNVSVEPSYGDTLEYII
jgi:hypothetical protein